MVSETHVPVGRYHLKESFAPVLQSIFDKYGDIGERYRRKLLFGINCYASYITSISCTFDHLTSYALGKKRR